MSLPNHDELAALFQKDPVAFELKRKELINEHISSSKDSAEILLKTQSNIDCKLK
jgi:hypothetical protein